MQQFLEAHENLLPVRAAWLAWVSLGKLSRGDVLALARARDRLLERLFQSGLSPDRDLPSFLRFTGARSSDHFRTFRDWLLRLPELVRRWVHRVNRNGLDAKPEDTEGYASLILAYGLARLGEADECRTLLLRAKELLGHRDDVHGFLMEAFVYRIEQALAGKPPGGPLPPEYHEHLEAMERIPR